MLCCSSEIKCFLHLNGHKFVTSEIYADCFRMVNIDLLIPGGRNMEYITSSCNLIPQVIYVHNDDFTLDRQHKCCIWQETISFPDCIECNIIRLNGVFSGVRKDSKRIMFGTVSQLFQCCTCKGTFLVEM